MDTVKRRAREDDMESRSANVAVPGMYVLALFVEGAVGGCEMKNICNRNL